MTEGPMKARLWAVEDLHRLQVAVILVPGNAPTRLGTTSKIDYRSQTESYVQHQNQYL